MCAEFEITFTARELLEQDKLLRLNPQLAVAQQIFPYNYAPVIKPQEAELHILTSMRFCLVPAWSKVEKPKFATYNARLDRINLANKLEYIYEAPTWRNSFRDKRCIVPLSSFIEACSGEYGSHRGNIVRFHEVNYQVLFAAGIYDKWTNPTSGEIINSFAITTDEPTDYIKQIGHDRMPVFLHPRDFKLWFDTKHLVPHQAYEFLKTNQTRPSLSV
ncbi:MAG: SOS response-associated peptidase, partial [Burkholderiales bacterium]